MKRYIVIQVETSLVKTGPSVAVSLQNLVMNVWIDIAKNKYQDFDVVIRNASLML